MSSDELAGGLRLQAYGAWGGTDPKAQADDDRLRQIAYRPTLIIGLGGTGLTVVQKMRRRIRRFFRQEDREIFQFLVFDTIGQATSKYMERLTDREFHYLGGVDGDGLIRRLERFPRLEEWWPRKDYFPGYISQGAKSVRCIGRLALFQKIDTVQAALQRAVASAVDVAGPRLAERSTNAAGAKVYIVSSLCGGTGSGMFLDLAYLARAALQDQGLEVSMTGILAMPEAFFALDRSPAQQSWWRANAYASLKELDRFMGTGQYYVQYTQFNTVDQTKKPFDVCYLIGATNERGQTLQDYEGLTEMVAEEIFTEVVSPIGEQQEAVFDNVDSVKRTSRDGKSAGYSSFSIASLVFLAEELAGYCAARNHIDFADNVLLTAPAELENSAAHLVERFVGSQQIREKGHDELIDFLGSDGEGNPLGGLEVYSDELRVPNSELLNTVASIEEERNTLLAQHAKSMIRRREQKLARVCQALNGDLAAILTDPDKGLLTALRYLEVLAAQMEAYRSEEMLSEEREWSGRIAELGRLRMDPNEETELGIAKYGMQDALASHFFVRSGRIGRAVEDYAEVSSSTIRAHFELERRRQGAHFYADLLREIEQVTRQLGRVEATLRNEQNQLRLQAERFIHSNQFMCGDYALAMGIVDQQQLDSLYAKYALRADAPESRKDAFQLFLTHLKDKTGKEMLGLDDFVTEDGVFLSKALYEFLGQRFVREFEKMDVVSVISEVGGEGLLETYIPNLFKRAVPFWNWDETELYGSTVAVENKNAMGIGEERWAERVRKQVGENFTAVETKDRFAITMLRTSHGLPLHALRALAREGRYYNAYQEFMEQWRAGGGRPLHISNTWEREFPDIHPREHVESYEIFAVGLAMNYVYETGSWYYVEPIQEPGKPARDPYQLQHGLRGAVEVFVHHPDAMKTVRKRVEDRVLADGRDVIRELLRKGRDDFYLKSQIAGVNRDLYAEMKAWVEQYCSRSGMPLPLVE